MPKYLWQVSYSAEGTRGLLKEGGSSRRAMVENLVKGVGGTLESFYFAFGEVDVFLIVDLPSAEAASAVSLTVSASGAASVKTIALLTPEQIDQAVKQQVQYRAPGA